MASTSCIRPIAICVFRDGDKILVAHGYDPNKNQHFYRPLGGGIEFGESAEATVRREMKEELDAEVEDLRRLAVLENTFVFEGRPGHEIVFVFDGRFSDPAIYRRARMALVESNGEHFEASWHSLDAIAAGSIPLYPDGLLALLRAAPSLP